MTGPAPPFVRGEWIPMTYEEFWDWLPEPLYGEWYDGEGIIFLPPTLEHQDGKMLMVSLLDSYARLFDLGQGLMGAFEVKLREGARVQPDVLFVAKAHAERWGDGTRLWGSPDFVVEILADDTASHDRGRKCREYETAGVPEYLMIDRRQLPGVCEFHRLDAGGRYQPVTPDERGRYHSLVLPGFWFDPVWFWEEPLPWAERLMLQIAPEAYRAYIRDILGERDETLTDASTA